MPYLKPKYVAGSLLCTSIIQPANTRYFDTPTSQMDSFILATRKDKNTMSRCFHTIKITYIIFAKLSFKAVHLSVYVSDITILINSSCQTTVSLYFFLSVLFNNGVNC